MDKLTVAGLEAGFVAALFLALDWMLAAIFNPPSSVSVEFAVTFYISAAILDSLVAAVILVKLRNRIPGGSMIVKALFASIAYWIFIDIVDLYYDLVVSPKSIILTDYSLRLLGGLGWALVFGYCFSMFVSGMKLKGVIPEDTH